MKTHTILFSVGCFFLSAPTLLFLGLYFELNDFNYIWYFFISIIIGMLFIIFSFIFSRFDNNKIEIKKLTKEIQLGKEEFKELQEKFNNINENNSGLKEMISDYKQENTSLIEENKKIRQDLLLQLMINKLLGNEVPKESFKAIEREIEYSKQISSLMVGGHDNDQNS